MAYRVCGSAIGSGVIQDCLVVSFFLLGGRHTLSLNPQTTINVVHQGNT
jgi:hypothetical protein